MDEIVKQAMAKWPNVPHCYGWLALDARGAWRMRDEQAQALHLPGDKIAHAALLGFINRNYMNGYPDAHSSSPLLPWKIGTSTKGDGILRVSKIATSVASESLNASRRTRACPVAPQKIIGFTGDAPSRP